MIYTIVNALSWFGSISVFAVGLAKKEKYPYMWVAGLVYFFTYPILYETLLNIKGYLCRSRLNQSQHNCSHLRHRFPIVYSSNYNITAGGLEKCHPFDSCKYRRIFESLQKKKIIDNTTIIHEPQLPSREFLMEKMSKFYLFMLNFSLYVCACLEVPLFFLPGWVLRWRVLDPMMRAT